MSNLEESNRPKAPRFPDRTALSRHQSIRSILALGRSHGITVPAAWLRSVYDPALPFLLCTVNDDGTCTLASLATLTPPAKPATPPDTHDRVRRPAERPVGT